MRNEIIEHNRATLNQLMDRNRDLLAEVNNPDNGEQVKMAMLREILRNTETVISHKEHFAIQGPIADMKVQEFHTFIDSARSWLNNR